MARAFPARATPVSRSTGDGHDREPVLMLHGRNVSALAGGDLAQVPGGDPDRYSVPGPCPPQKVEGLRSGSYFREFDGNLIELP
ncbi:hypothetical protein CTU88_24685 [Streptomyces sp. JV178]|nr:hypothetical protein CTU88_24685 [Streptomyces sp. JV178]